MTYTHVLNQGGGAREALSTKATETEGQAVRSRCEQREEVSLSQGRPGDMRQSLPHIPVRSINETQYKMGSKKNLRRLDPQASTEYTVGTAARPRYTEQDK